MIAAIYRSQEHRAERCCLRTEVDRPAGSTRLFVREVEKLVAAARGARADRNI